MSKITQNTLNDLEFEQVLKIISGFCLTDLGKEQVLHIKPFANIKKLLTELAITNEYLSSFQNNNRIPNHYFEEISKELLYVRIVDSYLEGKALLKLSAVSKTVLILKQFFEKFKEIYPNLHEQSLEVAYEPAVSKLIEKYITNFGEVKDDSSIELSVIRRRINHARGQISASFNKSLGHYSSLGYLDDIKESVVENQRVLAVQAMNRKKVKGSILGSSKTGSIVYIAPESTLKFTRELNILEYEEKEELIKILRKLTDELRPFEDILRNQQTYLTALDVSGSKAKYAHDINACLPKISKEKIIDLQNAYHPLLWAENKKKKVKTIPQSIRLDAEQRIIVISGPNAGGKSITLKTVGLLQVMLQSAILIPVNEKSRATFFDKILTDIGDNQSIENHLSTYSYRLKNMRQFLEKCNKNTLFLIDEFGTGSDPELGGALAEVFLEEFYENGSYGIITTHYANLKVLADELPEVLNANMQFDQKTLEPLYKLITGQAGSSFTFEVAQKNGIPFRLINRAKKKVEREKIRLDKTIAKLQTERNVLRKTSEELEKEKALAEESSQILAEKQAKIQAKVNQFQELYDQNQKMLMYGRQLNQILHKFFQSENKKELKDQLMKWVGMEHAKHKKQIEEKKSKVIDKVDLSQAKPISKRERKKINEQVRKEEKIKKDALLKVEQEILEEVKKVRKIKIAKEKKIAREQSDYEFKVNDRVRMIEGTAKGTIEKIEKNVATINYGMFTAKTNVDQLELVESGKK
ncbi:endonuclease MutS2 [Namhaeicola litoreus]|uniref:DNA mismatch repair protein MutS n=1 Tax=Namhaeicola litoreus TaxID=1052145 RepID=A0ABW3Y3K3_9FLAO